MKMKSLAIVGTLLLLACALTAQTAIPAGTVIPVQLNKTIEAAKVKAGDPVTARVAQDVILPSGERIKAGARVSGHVESVTLEPRAHASMTMRFERVISGGQSIPLHLSLRALASPLEVEAAQTQTSGFDRGSDPPWSQTVMLVGFTDVVYRENGTVIDGEDEVGRSVYAGNWGVMSRVSSQPGTPCRAAVAGNDRPQALWVFSHDACGVYGYEMTIASAGRRDPKGSVVLTGQLRELKLRGGTAMLLRVN
jgi:hypothetical protein